MTLGSGTESAFIIDGVFWVIAVLSLVAAVAVVQVRDLFRAALFLVVSFLGVAGMFVLLRAEFLAVVQVLIYIGAMSVLIIFAILMTRDVADGNPSNQLKLPAAVLAFLFFLVTMFVVFNTEWNLIDKAIPNAAVSDRVVSADHQILALETVELVDELYSDTIPAIGRVLLRDFVLAFEAVSVLLLAALVGALALVRER